jgi:hypothetical protein
MPARRLSEARRRLHGRLARDKNPNATPPRKIEIVVTGETFRWFSTSCNYFCGSRVKHHNLHRLTGRKLKCLTALHNFHTKRKDGTTPAQRFFEDKHPNLFEHLLKTLKPPGRPRIATRLAMAA